MNAPAVGSNAKRLGLSRYRTGLIHHRLLGISPPAAGSGSASCR
ncbi:MAG: hypothetical protein ACJ8J0_15020 [Longimicrobiaceae bacterium]